MTRNDFFTELAKHLLQIVSPDAARLCTGRSLSRASATILFIAKHYEDGAVTDELCDMLFDRSLVERTQPRPVVLEELVLPIRDAYHSGTLPLPRYWNVNAAFLDQLGWHLSLLPDNEELLRELGRWGWGSSKTTTELKDALVLRSLAPWPPLLAKTYDQIREAIGAAIPQEGLTQLIEARLQKTGAVQHERSDLVDIARCVTTIAVLRQAVPHLLPTEEGARIKHVLDRIGQHLGEELEKLSYEEMRLLAPLDPATVLLEECLQRTPRPACSEMIDLVNEETIIPECFKDRLNPGHSTHTAVGPLPYLIIVTDENAPPPTSVTVRSIAEYPEKLGLVLALADDPQLVQVPYHNNAAHLRELILMTVVRRFLVHILTDNTATFCPIRIKNHAEQVLREQVLAKLREQYNSNAREFAQAYNRLLKK